MNVADKETQAVRCLICIHLPLTNTSLFHQQIYFLKKQQQAKNNWFNVCEIIGKAAKCPSIWYRIPCNKKISVCSVYAGGRNEMGEITPIKRLHLKTTTENPGLNLSTADRCSWVLHLNKLELGMQHCCKALLILTNTVHFQLDWFVDLKRENRHKALLWPKMFKNTHTHTHIHALALVWVVLSGVHSYIYSKCPNYSH